MLYGFSMGGFPKREEVDFPALFVKKSEIKRRTHFSTGSKEQR